MESKRLDNAALAAGSARYINAHGKPQSIGAETKRVCLTPCIAPPRHQVAVTPVPNVMVYTQVRKCRWRLRKRRLSTGC
jgi:4-alpha-glucanotransferase